MIRILFKQALDEKSFREGRRITLNEVSEETGISRPTLTRISNVPGYNTNTETISALCDYFEIEPGELLKKVWPLGANWARFGHRILKGRYRVSLCEFAVALGA